MAKLIAECWLLDVDHGHVIAAVAADDSPQFAPTWSCEVANTTSPQSCIRRAAPPGLDIELLHSTSWRFSEGAVHLSLVAITPGPTHAVGRIVRPYKPSTEDEGEPLGYVLVVSHAVRHVAFLLMTDTGFVPSRRSEWELACQTHLPDVFRDLSR